MSDTATGSTDPFGEVHELLELLKDLTLGEKVAAGPAIQSKVDAAAIQYPTLITAPGVTHLKDLVSLRKILDTHGIESQGLSQLIANAIKGVGGEDVANLPNSMTHKIFPLSLNKIFVFSQSGDGAKARKFQNPIYLRFSEEFEDYIVVNSYGRHVHHNIRLSPKAMGLGSFFGSRLVIYHKNSSLLYHAMISMDGSDALDDLIADLGTHTECRFQEQTSHSNDSPVAQDAINPEKSVLTHIRGFRKGLEKAIASFRHC